MHFKAQAKIRKITSWIVLVLLQKSVTSEHFQVEALLKTPYEVQME
jgi:hypothetical protein